MGDSRSTVMYKIVHEDPITLNVLNRTIPAGVSAAVMKALGKDPTQRFPTCSAFAAAVRVGLAGGTVELPADPNAGLETVLLDPQAASGADTVVVETAVTAGLPKVPAAGRRSSRRWRTAFAAGVVLAALGVWTWLAPPEPAGGAWWALRERAGRTWVALRGGVGTTTPGPTLVPVVVTPELPDDPSLPAVPGLALPPGDHTISIVDSRASVFEETVSVVDRSSLVVPVQLRPAIALLGILGGDEIGAAKLRTALEQADGELEQWAILSREERGGTVLEQAGVTADSLRQLASTGKVDATLVDWEAVQTAVDQYTSVSLYMVGVLSDDLVASHADLWVWLPAPGPTQPARVRVGLDDGSAAATIRDAFATELILRRQWLGAILIDSDAAAGPVVTRITEEGPAARAGLLVGDVISAIGAQKVETVAAAGERLSALDPEAIVTLAVLRRGRAETVEVRLGSSPSVPVPADSTALYPAVLTLLTRRLETGDTSEPAWVIQLSQAAVLMQAGAWEQAVDTLRQNPDAPAGPGLGRAAVDYWYGIAASALGPGYYDIARAAFSRTASVPGATLFHNDGPLVAPRAQARLQLLGGAAPPE